LGHRLGGFCLYLIFGDRGGQATRPLRHDSSSSHRPRLFATKASLPEPFLNRQHDKTSRALLPSLVISGSVVPRTKTRFVMSEETPTTEREAFLPPGAVKVHRLERGAQCSVQ